MIFLARRKTKKNARETLRLARHLRNMREDTFSPADAQKLAGLETDLEQSLKDKNFEAIAAGSVLLNTAVIKLAPTERWGILRENLEVFVVAVVIAMAVRTYFLQPFKIPTGSMQPTLYGIVEKPYCRPSWSDRAPFKYAKWLATGEWYTEIRAKASGELVDMRRRLRSSLAPPMIKIGKTVQKVPRDAELLVDSGEYVTRGSLLWSGKIVAGDHVFVNKVIWNFRRPRRGEIMVFNTDNIPIQLPPLPPLPDGTHYIKRLVGLPGETISIDPPNVLADDRPLLEPETIRKIVEGPGYRLAQPERYRPSTILTPKLMSNRSVSVQLGQGSYFALGDNTASSKDSRYWGAVPEKNLVGPAVIVYWPFSERWGLAR